MRQLTRLAALILALGVPLDEPSAAEPNRGTSLDVNRGIDDDTIDTTLQGGSSSQAVEQRSSGRTGRSKAAQVYIWRRPRLRFDTAVGWCVVFERVTTASEKDAQAMQDRSNILWEQQYADLPRCPANAVPTDTPSFIAEEFWRVQLQDLLDKPKPSIAPGYMLAGKLGYLETNARMVQRFTHDTPLGLLRIEARGRLFVDWGDGTGLAGPYSDPGKPWPDGTITHSWTDAARYDVVVTQRWTATWELAGRTGSFDGLSTVGRIEEFEVRQLQAVRNR